MAFDYPPLCGISQLDVKDAAFAVLNHMPTGIPYAPKKRDQDILTLGLEWGVPLAKIAHKIGISVPTLMKHYAEVIDAARLKRGPKPYEPTKEERTFVVVCASEGSPHVAIAATLGMSKGSLENLFPEELRTGSAVAHLKVIGNLFKAATGPTDKMTTVIAAIWWTKARLGWRAPRAAANQNLPVRPSESLLRVWVPEERLGQYRYVTPEPSAETDEG